MTSDPIETITPTNSSRGVRRPAAIAVGVAAAVGVGAGLRWVRQNRSQVQRTAALVKLGGRNVAVHASARARGVGATPERAAELRANAELRTAEDVAQLLGNMKGAMMKIGQMASYLDPGLPEPVREALAQLQQDAPPMSDELVHEMVRSELGFAPDVVFAEWDDKPIAAASIGQVHRAVTHDGEERAVKVQYPGVAEAMRADLANADLVFGGLGMMFSGMDPGPIVEELKARLSEELDYALEAENQRLFAAYYEGHPTIHVPKVDDRYSTSRVLTTEFVHGARFAEMQTWSQEERNLAAETIYRYVFGGIYRLRVFNGDPHPGNYLFHKGGKVTFLDYGLVKHFPPGEVDKYEQLIVHMLHDDATEFRRAVEAVGFLQPNPKLSDQQVSDYFQHFYVHVKTDAVTTFDPEWSAESVRRYFDVSSPHAEVMKSANLPADSVIVQRINLGLFAVLGDMSVYANWRRIAEEIWPSTLGPPSTPMGESIARWERERGAVTDRVGLRPDH